MAAPLAMRLLDQLPLRAGQRVLDVACGTGIVARLAAPRVAPSGSVAGVDIDEKMLAVARTRAADEGLSIAWKQADAGELPFADASFDVVVCQQGLQFFPDRVRAVREMRRVVSDRGIVALAVAGAPTAYNTALAQALTRRGHATAAMRCLAPFVLADPLLIRSIVSDAGFSAIDLRTEMLVRRFEPTQEWLLQESAGRPYGGVIAEMDDADRAAMVREIAAALSQYWKNDSFSIPREVHFVLARK
jgi:ubiquinone/menaquinone biosynthesis C-methylase UbiE